MPTSSTRSLLSAAAVALVSPTVFAQNASFRLVVEGLDPAPGTTGRVFSQGTTFSRPAINADGEVAFQGLLIPTTGSANSGIWSEGRTGALELVALADTTPAPGVPGAVFSGFFAGGLPAPILNDDGDVAFIGSLTGGGVTALSNSGIWRQEAGVLELVVRQGDAAPGAPGATFFQFGSPSAITFNEAGHVSFLSFLLGGGVNASNEFGIWSTSTGILDKVARQGDVAAGFTESYRFLFLPPVLSGQGTVAFNGTLTGFGGKRAIWKGVANSLVVVAKRGDNAPGTGGGTFNNFYEASFTPEVNDAGRVAFLAELSNAGPSPSSIWSDAAGALTLIAREGGPAPGTSTGFAPLNESFVTLLLNGQGDVAFRAALTGVAANNDSGIWAQRNGSLGLVAREGEAAPGTGGASFGDMHPAFSRAVAFNNRSQVAFFANLVGPGVTTANNAGIWMTDTAGNLQLVIRKGDVIEVAPGTFRTAVGVGDFISNSGGQNGRPRALNDLGELALRVVLDNNHEALLVASLPGCAPPVVTCPAAANSVSPTGATTGSLGTSSLATNNFTLEASGLPPNTVGIFFYGDGQTNVPFGNGVRCIGGALFRLPVVPANAAGIAQFGLNFNSLPPGSQILAGDTRFFQFWYRDVAAAGAFFNASSGLQVTFCN